MLGQRRGESRGGRQTYLKLNVSLHVKGKASRLWRVVMSATQNEGPRATLRAFPVSAERNGPAKPALLPATTKEYGRQHRECTILLHGKLHGISLDLDQVHAPNTVA